MTPEPIDQKVEIALLHGLLWQVTRVLKDYHDSPHYQIDAKEDGRPMMEVIVPESVRDRAKAMIEKANAKLRGNDKGIQI